MKLWQKRKKSQTPQPGIEPGTPASAPDALPLSHRDKRHHQPVCFKFCPLCLHFAIRFNSRGAILLTIPFHFIDKTAPFFRFFLQFTIFTSVVSILSIATWQKKHAPFSQKLREKKNRLGDRQTRERVSAGKDTDLERCSGKHVKTFAQDSAGSRSLVVLVCRELCHYRLWKCNKVHHCMRISASRLFFFCFSWTFNWGSDLLKV